MRAHFSEDCFAQAVIQLHATVRVCEVSRVIVPEKRRYPDSFKVEIPKGQKARACRSQCRAKSLTAVPVGVQINSIVCIDLRFSRPNSVRKSIDELLMKAQRHAIRGRDIEAQRSSEFEIAPEHPARSVDSRKLCKPPLAEDC